ncbi:hypothetical protein BEL05_06160 [Shewanella colwelliana]|uniref:Uncharacterized protein n=1 Tax=Shewanella colwelliana TaxID=23 RepID=A0A1E5IVZ4_SHECO|nr:hypothetical protein [Shewanella colwelliana]OEG74676.1 hypothetical protein BEL05_06160 [Shewanella colwelliana]
MYPGFLVSTLASEYYDKAVVSTLIAFVAAFFFHRYLAIYKKSDGYLKCFFISTFLLSGNFSIPVWSSAAKNDAGNLVFLLLFPLMFIVNYLLTKSEPAKHAVALYNRAYNK